VGEKTFANTLGPSGFELPKDKDRTLYYLINELLRWIKLVERG
jgi:hypothetical protein